MYCNLVVPDHIPIYIIGGDWGFHRGEGLQKQNIVTQSLVLNSILEVVGMFKPGNSGGGMHIICSDTNAHTMHTLLCIMHKALWIQGPVSQKFR